MGDLASNQGARNDADHFAARRQGGIGDLVHQADRATTIDEPQPAARQKRSESARAFDVDAVVARARAAEYADALHARSFNRVFLKNKPRVHNPTRPSAHASTAANAGRQVDRLRPSVSSCTL